MTQSATAEATDNYFGDTQMSLTIPDQAMVIMERKNGEMIFSTNPSDIKTIHVLTPLKAEGSLQTEGSKIAYTCTVVPDILPDQALSQYIRKIPEPLSGKIFDKAVMRVPQLVHQLNDKGTVYDEQSTSYENRDYKLYYMFVLQ